MTASRCPVQHEAVLAEDPLWEELYDVRNEALAMGNLIDGDPYADLARLREQAPVHRGSARSLMGLPEHYRHVMAEGRQAYCALSFAACEAAFRDPKHFSSHIVHHPNPDNEKTMVILEMDGAEHRAYRRTLQPIFIRPQAFGWWRTRFIDEIVELLVDRLKQQDRAELNLELCARLPVHTITRAMGLKGEDALIFRKAFHSSGLRGISDDVRREAAATIQRMLMGEIAKRHADPQDDLITRLITAEVRLPSGEVRKLTDREAMHTARLVMVAGGGTTWRQMGIVLYALLTHPEALSAVREDRALIENAVDEATRWNPTAPVFNRLVTTDTELHGVSIPAGSVMEICLGAANRDPSRWDNPDQFDLFRAAQPHLGFGIGEHRCMGIDVARSEMIGAISALLDAFPNLRLDPGQPVPHMTGGLEQRGVSALPVLLG